MDSISIVMPAYNEGTRIHSSLERVESYLEQSGVEHEIIVVDDGSTDNTLQAVRAFAESGAPVIVVHYDKNRGKGYAVRKGMEAASKSRILMTDADLAAPIDQTPKLEQALEQGYDIAIGSRAVRGAVVPVRQPLYRTLAGRGLNLVIQAFAVPGIKDTQCGFKLFKQEAAKNVFKNCVIDGFGFDIEALYLARKLGYKVKEVGVTWSHQEGSKVRPFRDGFRILKDIWCIRTTKC